MDMLMLIYMIFIFAVVFSVVLLILYRMNVSPELKRLGQVAKPSGAVSEKPAAPGGIWQSLAKLSLPKTGWEESALRVKFVNAGYRSNSAPTMFFASKTILAVLFPVLFLAYMFFFRVSIHPGMLVAAMALTTAAGFFSPNIYLQRRIAGRRRQIFESFPDAIDLMTVCVEAGLGLDEAIGRVGEEIVISSPILSEELHLVSLELRAGGEREKALRNLALRTGVEEIDMLVATLIQSDRFGTSVGDALRVHSDSLRTKRRLIAEEEAAKVPVKLLFPLVFCIFPSLLLVLLGPAAISIYRSLLPVLGSVGH